jgi:hypothetical protein
MFAIGDDSRAALQDRHRGFEAGEGLPQFQRYRPPADDDGGDVVTVRRYTVGSTGEQFQRNARFPH